MKRMRGTRGGQGLRVRGLGSSALSALTIFFIIIFPGAGQELEFFYDEVAPEVLRFLLSGVTARTKALYEKEFTRFQERTKNVWWDLGAQERDRLVAHYLVKGYYAEKDDEADRHVSKTEAGYLLSMMRFRDPMLKYDLSHRVAATWRKRDPGHAAWPLTPEMTTAISACMKEAGSIGGAVANALTFSNLLRIGETLKLRWRDVFLPDAGEDRAGALYLPTTKTGVDQYVPLEDEAVMDMMRRWRRRTGGRKDERVFNMKYYEFRLLFLAAVAALNLSSIVGSVWRTHSLRRGGATFVLQCTRSPEYCCVLGRWASLPSCRRYLKAGEALVAKCLAAQTLKVHARVQAMQLSVEELFA